jgi:hypothetical protein
MFNNPAPLYCRRQRNARCGFKISEANNVAYRPFLIRKQADGAATYNSAKEWNLYCSSFPFKIFGEAKAVPSRSWNDEDGDEEYIPPTLYVQSYEIDVEFACRGNKESSYSNIMNFLKYITGRDLENDSTTYGSTLQIQDLYTGIGRQRCRYSKMETKGHEIYDVLDDSVEEEVLTTFTLTFKVNDPVTDITLKE